MPAVDPHDEYQIELPEFEGPLDLLLHLVKRHELSIVEIPISFITERYLEYLELMRSLNIDVAGEYLLMAATLAHIKSRELLPRKDDELEDGEEEDEGDPRQNLIRRLLEYQRYKMAANSLAERPKMGRMVFGRGSEMEPVDPSERPLAPVSTFALITALADVIKRSKIQMSYDVTVDRISITDRINQLVDRLADQETIPFEECFNLDPEGDEPVDVRSEIVVTFLAMLELARLRMIRVLQQAIDGPIYITRTEAMHQIDSAEASFA